MLAAILAVSFVAVSLLFFSCSACWPAATANTRSAT